MRMEIVTYVIVSIFLSLLTTAILSLAIFMAKDFIIEGGQAYAWFALKSEDSSILNDVPKHEVASGYFGEETGIMFKENHSFTIFMISMAVVSFVFFFMIYFLAFTKKITDYFNEISKGLVEVSEGNFDIVFDVRNEDELSNVATVINNTLAEIKKIMTKERDEERNRKEFITSIAHDLRTPLTSIIGYLQLVMAKEEESFENRELAKRNGEYIKVAYDKALRLQSLIEDLFSFTKTDSVGIIPHFNEIDLVKLVEQLVDECYPSIYDAGLEVEVNKNADSMPALVDGELMARAIANLLTNGIKYGKDGKKLIVELEKEEKEIKIRIINYGRLIPKKELTKIFEKFYRVEESRSVETGGTGLGLAIAQNIIKIHKGMIDVRSDIQGTVFEVRLPIGAVNRREEYEG